MTNYSNRGLSLENELDYTNQIYREKGIAIVYKKPTPIQVVRMSKTENKITDAYFKKPSTTDYNGIYQGLYIDFEAKETTSKTSFPLSNIHLHQIKHLLDVERHKGISFIIVRFTTLNETYLLQSNILEDYYNKKENRKSIPLDVFKTKGYLIKPSGFIILDYIKIIKDYLLR